MTPAHISAVFALAHQSMLMVDQVVGFLTASETQRIMLAFGGSVAVAFALAVSGAGRKSTLH